jgi:hypothetical protein
VTEPRPWLSGFCNPSNPPDSHDRCHGTTAGKGGVVLVCSCPHHAVPAPVVEDLRPRGVAGMSLAELQASITAATQGGAR